MTTKMKNLLMRFLRDEQGQDLVEYTLLMAFVCLASAAVFNGTAGSVSKVWSGAGTVMSKAAVAAS